MSIEAIDTMRLLAIILLTLVAEAALVLLVYRWNVATTFHPGFFDLRNPLADPWSPDPRYERGWPLKVWREFVEPSSDNAAGRVDGLALGINMLVWLVLVGLVALPMLVTVAIQLWRRRGGARATSGCVKSEIFPRS